MDETTVFVLVLLFWLGGCVIAGYVATQKHRKAAHWFFLSLILSPPFALLALTALPMGLENMRICNDCTLPVHEDARVCNHCGLKLA